MSDETGRMSEEDKFLGVKTTIEPPEPQETTDQADNFEVEVVSDEPVVSQADSDQDTELSQYSEKVQKRINKATARFRAEEKEKVEASKLAEEAVGYASQLKGENQRLVELVRQSQEALNEQSKGRASASLQMAEENFKKAHELGDANMIAETQKDLTRAQLAEAYAPTYGQKVIDNWKNSIQQEQPSPQEVQQLPPQPDPDPKAVEWQNNNPWFMENEEMTGTAVGYHRKLEKDGVDLQSDEYYQLIDKRMREVYPTQFGNDTTQEQYSTGGTVEVDTGQRRRANPVVAPASRNTGATPRKVTLSETQVRLAKRLGLTPQQYATQLMKEQN